MATHPNTPELEPSVLAELAYLQKYRSFEELGHGSAYDLAKPMTSSLPHQALEINSAAVSENKPESQEIEDDYEHVSCSHTVSILEEDGSRADYTVKRLKIHNLENDGLMAHILIPKAVNGTPEIKVVFRGTASWDGAKCDAIEGGGAGAETFAANRDLILKQINEEVKKLKEQMPEAQSVKIKTSGHSLGGALAQLCTTALMDAEAQNCGLTSDNPIPKDCRDGMVHVSKLTLAVQNAAGIPLETAKRAEAVAGYLAGQRDKRKNNLGKGTALLIETYNLIAGGDAVQKTGEAHFLSNVSAKFAKVNVLKIPTALEGIQVFDLKTAAATVLAGGYVGAAVVATSAVAGLISTYLAHTGKYLKSNTNPTYESYNNSTVAGQQKVDEILGSKTWALNFLQKLILNTAKTFNQSVSHVKDELKNVWQKISGTKQETTPTVVPGLTPETAANAAILKPAVSESAPQVEMVKSRSFWPSWSYKQNEPVVVTPAAVVALDTSIKAETLQSAKKSRWFY